MRAKLYQKPKKVHKKGSVFDMVITFSFLILIFVVGGISLFIYSSFNDAWQDNTVVNQESKDAAQGHEDRFIMVLDGAIVLYFIILWITSIVSSLFLDSNPVFFIIFIVISIISLIGVVGLNILGEAILNSDLQSAFASMPISSFIVEQAFMFAIVYFLSVGAALYFKSFRDNAI